MDFNGTSHNHKPEWSHCVAHYLSIIYDDSLEKGWRVRNWWVALAYLREAIRCEVDVVVCAQASHRMMWARKG